jgi:hypothetical protein
MSEQRIRRAIRRDSFQVRRDAAVELPNGRIAYDALFTRWGVQPYPDGNEYRPFDEVEKSMATLGALPGTLLHPDANFGLTFGEGAYPVRGCTAEGVAWAADRIHTKGRLIVWDAEWNDLISSVEVVDLSNGYTTNFLAQPVTAPDGAPGVSEHGADCAGTQTEIIGDHMAGVPEGNAGTARVVLDSSQRSIIQPATRRMLADVAASRMDARPMYYDLGTMAKSWSWPQRETQDEEQPMEKQALYQAKLDELAKAGTLTSKARADAWVDIYGDTTDPDMLAMLSGLASTPTAAPAAPAPVEPVADAEEEEPEEEPAEEMEEDEGTEKKDAAKAKRRADAIKARHDAEDSRADTMYVARSVFGPDFDGRADGARMSTAAVQLACLGKMDAARAADISELSPADQAVALRLDFKGMFRDVRDAVYTKPLEELMSAVAAARGDSSDSGEEDLAKVRAKYDALTQQAGRADGRRTKTTE